MSTTADEAPLPSPLEIRAIEHREDAEDSLILECPYCQKRESYTHAQEAQLWKHKCGTAGLVYMVNGFAMKGVAEYNRTNIPRGRA